jgi:hypothetical protein
MGHLQAKTNNNMIPSKTLATSPNENNLHSIATRKPLALNGRSEESKQNLATTSRDWWQWWQAKTALLNHPTPTEVFLSRQGRKGKTSGTWNYGTRRTSDDTDAWRGGGGGSWKIPDRNGQLLSLSAPEPRLSSCIELCLVYFPSTWKWRWHFSAELRLTFNGLTGW